MSRDGEPHVVDGTYELEETLGAGAMGSVHRARHVHLGKVFALKLINPSVLARRDGRRRFETEARALGRLSHTNIVRVTDYGIDDRDTPYLVMEHLDGETLSELVARSGPLPPERALAILQAIAEGLDFAHSQGVLHRDLKPHNVFVSRAASGVAEVKIVDFGLARMVDTSLESVADSAESLPTAPPASGLDDQTGPTDASVTVDDRPHLGGAPVVPRSTSSGTRLAAPEDSPDGATLGAATRVGAVIGTAAYMAPEVADGQGATLASDLYSFGVLAFEILVGRRPFVGGYANVLRAHVFDDPPAPSSLNPSLPVALDTALLAALAKQPGARPASAQSYVGGLRRALASVHRQRWTRRELPRRTLLAVALSALALTAAWVLAGWSVVADLEHRLVDARFRRAAPLPPSPALCIVLLDDATLAADPTGRATSAYADEFGSVLRAALDGGALGVGLDIMVPASWAESEPFFRLLVERPEQVALAVHAAANETLVGAEVAEGAVTLALGPTRAAQLFAYANLRQERDGCVRELTRGFYDLDGTWHPTLAGRVAEIVTGQKASGRVDAQLVDYRLDWRQIPTRSWRDFRQELDADPAAAAGRFLLVGGRIEGFGDEDYPVPHPGGKAVTTAPGVVVQAAMAATVIAAGGLAPASTAVWLAASSPLVVALLAVLWLRRVTVAVAGLGAFVAVYAAASALLFTRAAVVLPTAPLVLVVPLVGALAVMVRFKLPARP